MSSPPGSTPWVPLWPNEPKQAVPAGIPAPVSGRWLKAEGGAAIWKDPITDADAAWHEIGAAGEPAFLNGWRNYGGFTTAAFRRLSNGMVAFKGLLSADSWPPSGTTAFVLPAAYRPALEWNVHTMCADNTARLRVYPGGNCDPLFVTAGYFYLDGVRFWPGAVFPPFTPTDLTGLKIWVDASQLALADGASVTSWPNLASGGPVNSINGTPTVRTTAKGNVVRFTSTSFCFFNFAAVNQNYTVIFYARYVGAGYRGRVFSSTANSLAGFWSNNMDCLHMGSWAAGPPAGGVADDGAWKLWSVDGSTSLARMFKNGAGIPMATLVNPPSGWANQIQLNGWGGTTSETGDCEIAEVIVYDRKLSDGDRQRVENYLWKKWV